MIRAGFVGLGAIANVHLTYLKGRDDVEIAALCDVNAELAQKRREEFGGEVFAGFGEMLEKVELDAVWLCTPPQVRRDPLVECARKGIPVFCEKPVERDARAGAEIAEALASLDAKVQVGYCYRSTPCVATLREAWADDTIHVVQSYYGCPMSLSDKVQTKSWLFDKEKSGGALIDQATHNLDLLRHLFGEVEEVHAAARNPVKAKKPGYTIEETIGLVLAFAKGPLVTHAHTWVADGWRNEIVMSGEKRFYRLQLNRREVTVEERPSGKRVIPKEGDLRLWDYENVRFLEIVKTGDWSTNPCDYADGLKTLELTLACDEAVERGKVELGK